MLKFIIIFIKRAKQDAKKLAKHENKSIFVEILIFFDMILSCLLFKTYTSDYINHKLYTKNIFRRLKEYQEWNSDGLQKYKYRKEQLKIRRILNKYSSIKYEHPAKWKKREKQYREVFDIGEGGWIQYGVIIWREHNQREKIKIGNNVLLARNIDLDYTGGLEIGNGVEIGEGTKILTHGHDYLGMRNGNVIANTNRVYLTRLTIEDNVWIGTHAIIMSGVKSIGKNSIIQAASVVTKTVPPNVIVAGNPAKIITEFPEGLRYNPITGNFGES